MTDDHTAEAIDAADEETPTATPPADATDDSEAGPAEDAGVAAARKEAARYRRRLRDTEAEVDRLRQVVDGHNRQTVERLAADRLTDPQDLWTAGVDLEQLVGDDGNVDPDTVAATIDEVLEGKPHWRKARFPTFDVGQGAGNAYAAPQPATVDDGWQSIIRTDTPPV